MKKIILCIIVLFLASYFCVRGNYLKAEESAETTKGLLEEYNTKKVLQEGIGSNFPTSETVTEDSLYITIGKMIDVILGLVGVLLIILVIYGGYLWFSADGNEEQIGKAKAYIMNAIIGLAIVLMAYMFTSYVMTRISGDIGKLT
ncbi:MAG: pilin [bacterium]